MTVALSQSFFPLYTGIAGGSRDIQKVSFNFLEREPCFSFVVVCCAFFLPHCHDRFIKDDIVSVLVDCNDAILKAGITNVCKYGEKRVRGKAQHDRAPFLQRICFAKL